MDKDNESVFVVELSAPERDVIVKALLSVSWTGKAFDLANTLDIINGIVEKMKVTETIEPE